jgi:hypothetical protein
MSPLTSTEKVISSRSGKAEVTWGARSTNLHLYILLKLDARPGAAQAPDERCGLRVALFYGFFI